MEVNKNRVFIPTTNAGKLREFQHAFSLVNKECIGLNSSVIKSNSEINWKVPNEDRETFLGNSYRKLSSTLGLFNTLENSGINFVLVDDSGLCVPGLNFAPGVHSATFAGIPRDDQKNRQFLIEKLQRELNLEAPSQEPAFFVCSLFFAERTQIESGYGIYQPFIESSVALDHFEALEPKIMAFIHRRLDQISSAAYGYSINLSFDEQCFRVGFVMGFCTGMVATYEQELLPGEGHGYDALFFPKKAPQQSFASIPLSVKNEMSHRSEALRGLNAMEKAHIVQGEILELF